MMAVSLSTQTSTLAAGVESSQTISVTKKAKPEVGVPEIRDMDSNALLSNIPPHAYLAKPLNGSANGAKLAGMENTVLGFSGDGSASKDGFYAMVNDLRQLNLNQLDAADKMLATQRQMVKSRSETFVANANTQLKKAHDVKDLQYKAADKERTSSLVSASTSAVGAGLGARYTNKGGVGAYANSLDDLNARSKAQASGTLGQFGGAAAGFVSEHGKQQSADAQALETQKNTLKSQGDVTDENLKRSIDDMDRLRAELIRNSIEGVKGTNQTLSTAFGSR